MENVFRSKLLDRLRVDVPKDSDNFIDFSGTRFPKGSFPVLPGPEIEFSNLDIVGDGFRSGPEEWSALVIALLCFTSDVPVLLELGASQGLWCVPFIRHAEILGLKNAYALGVEASSSRAPALDFWAAQKLNYTVSAKEDGFELLGHDWKFKWLQAAVSATEGFVRFPDINVETDNGASIIANTHFGHRSKTIEVKSITPLGLIDEVYQSTNKRSVSLLHLDLQGAEEQLLTSAGFSELAAISDVLVIGTHSIESEKISIELMGELGYSLLAINLSQYRYGQSKILFQDGEQVWISPEVTGRAIELGLIEWQSNEKILAKAIFLLSIERDRILSIE
jgi:hypothetical protein